MTRRELEILFRDGEITVRRSADGNLPFRYRFGVRTLLKALFPGQKRYALLCYRSVQETMPRWRSIEMEPLYHRVPDRLLHICRSAILDLEEYEHLRQEVGNLWTYVADASLMSAEALADPSKPSFAPYSAATAAGASLGSPDESIYTPEDTDFSIEPDLLDTHAYVAMDFAGCLWNENSDPQARRAYWLRFIKQDAPEIAEMAWQELVGELKRS